MKRFGALLLCGILAHLGCTATYAESGGVPEFHAFLSPAVICDVEIGDPVEIHFDVDESAVQFNGYEVTLQFDPDILEFVGVDEGLLFVDACPSSRFQDLVETDSTVTYTHVTLCADVSVDGPGRLSTFHFQTLAAGISPVDIVSDPDRTFVDAGLWVWPAHSSFPRQVVFDHSLVVVLDPTADVPTDPMDTEPPFLTVEPHPVAGSASLSYYSSRRSLISIDLVDVGGRVVWTKRLEPAVGLRRIPFPSVQNNGDLLKSGIYFASIRQVGVEPFRQKVIVVR